MSADAEWPSRSIMVGCLEGKRCVRDMRKSKEVGRREV